LSTAAPPAGWCYTSCSARDRVTDILALAPRITCPSLYVRGDQEEATFPGERFAELSGGPGASVVVPDCENFYNGREDVVTGMVCDFLRRQVLQ